MSVFGAISGSFAAILGFEGSKKWMQRDGFCGISVTGSGAPRARGLKKLLGFRIERELHHGSSGRKWRGEARAGGGEACYDAGMRGGRWRAIVLVGALGMVAAGRVEARSLDGFARCLRRAGATFYGTSWCPHCDAQRALFGRAARWLPYVECSIDGTQAIRPACAGIAGFPTWTFRDGSRVAGRMSLAELAAKTGCALDAPARDGPLMIEVPGGGGAPVPGSAGIEIIDVR